MYYMKMIMKVGVLSFFLYHILNICMYNNMYNIYLSIYINLFYYYSYSKREYILSVYGAMFLSSGSIDRKKIFVAV